MAVKVHVPNPNFNKRRGGVQFHNGVGYFEDEKVAYRVAKLFGYEVEKVDEEKTEQTKHETKSEEPAVTENVGEPEETEVNKASESEESESKPSKGKKGGKKGKSNKK